MFSRGDTLIQDHSKSWKIILLLFPTMKSPYNFSTFMKTFLLLCTLASLTLFFFFAFSTQMRFLQCPGGRCKTTTEYDDTYNDDNNLFLNTDYDETNLSHIQFGIGGSAATWADRKHYSELWWKPNVTRAYVWLDEPLANNELWPETSPPFRLSQNTDRFKYSCWYGTRSAIRIARIVKESFEMGLDGVRWFVMGDDDTVFFTENLVTVLGKYDHTQMYYIGGNSESVEQDVIHSYDMAYGGAGFAISYPLARELVRVLDGCIDRYDELYGSDQKIQGCLSEIGVPVTIELGFHQVDIRGNPYGLLSTHPVAPLVSLHHLDYVQSLFPELTQIDSIHKLVNAHKSDPGRTLQQSLCYDLRRKWSVSVSWDYTVQLYPYLVNAKELGTTFQTFQSWRSWSNEPFTFNTRPVDPDPCKGPVVFFLDRVEEGTTTYKRFVGEGNKCERPDARLADVQYFNVSAPKFNLNWWNKAPRRQCCEIINDKKGAKGVVQVNIRKCNRYESVTPP